MGTHDDLIDEHRAMKIFSFAYKMSESLGIEVKLNPLANKWLKSWKILR